MEEAGAVEEAGIIPVFEGPDEENDERSDTVRPSLASRPMSLRLAVYSLIL